MDQQWHACSFSMYLTPTGGAADAQQNFSLTIAFNGAPKTTTGKLTLNESDQARVFTASVGDKTPAVPSTGTHANTDTQR